MVMESFDGEGEAVHIRTEPQREVDAAHRSDRRWWPAAICCGLYVLLAILEFGVTKSLGSGQTSGPGTPDQVQQIWFLEWARYALAHGHNPFYTQWQNYPVGLNLLGNTSMMALGVLFSPITSLFGPIVTWNVLMRLALVVSATSMCLVLRRWTTWWPAAFVGGLLTVSPSM